MERFAPQRPDHQPPETLSDEQLAQAVHSLGRKVQSVRGQLRTARLAGGAMLAVIMLTGFTLAWVGPGPFMSRIYGGGEVVTIPTLALWWATVLFVVLFSGIVAVRLFSNRLESVRGWRNKLRELERRLEHAEAEARRRQ